MSIRPLRWLLLSILAISINTSVASASELVISSLALGERTEDVPGIESMSQEDIARQAALLALAPEGWNLEARGGRLASYGPPDQPGWDGGVEWAAHEIPADSSSDFGYDLNAEAWQYGPVRSLVFHTDDTLTRPPHDIGEPRPFGVISGTMAALPPNARFQIGGVYYIWSVPSCGINVAFDKPVSASLGAGLSSFVDDGDHLTAWDSGRQPRSGLR